LLDPMTAGLPKHRGGPTCTWTGKPTLHGRMWSSTTTPCTSHGPHSRGVRTGESQSTRKQLEEFSRRIRRSDVPEHPKSSAMAYSAQARDRVRHTFPWSDAERFVTSNRARHGAGCRVGTQRHPHCAGGFSILQQVTSRSSKSSCLTTVGSRVSLPAAILLRRPAPTGRGYILGHICTRLGHGRQTRAAC